MHRQSVEELIGEDYAAKRFWHSATIMIHANVAEPIKCRCHLSTARAKLDNDEVFLIGHLIAQLANALRDEDSEYGLHLFRGEKISSPAKRAASLAIVAMLRMVQGGAHESMKRNGAARQNFAGENFSNWRHAAVVRASFIEVF